MKKLLVLASLALSIQLGFAQGLLSSPTISGSVTAQTQSGHDVLTLGGSPRSGFYHYWRPVVLENTNSSVPLDFNAATGLVTSKGTYYNPGYRASGAATVSFDNQPSSAVWSVIAHESTTGIPYLPAHQWASASTTIDPRIYFTVANDTDVTIVFSGTATPSFNIYALSGEISGAESGKPNSYTLAAGGTYCFWATVTNKAGLLSPVDDSTLGPGGASMTSFGVTLTFAPVGG